jgi:hypothetical protein
MLAHVAAYSAYAAPGRVNQFTCATRQCVAHAPRAQSASHMGSENRHLRGRCSAFVFRVTAAIFEQPAQHRLPAVYGFRYFARPLAAPRLACPDPDELCRDFRNAFGAALRPAILNREVATIDPSEFTEPFHKSGNPLANAY